MKFSLYQLTLSINGDNTADQEIAAITAPAPTSAKTYVFIDTNLPDWQSLLSNIPADAKIAYLNSNQNGLSQIAHALEGQTDVQAIHILSHSTAASIGLGSLKLTAQNLAEQSPALKAISAALTADADILLYGCNIAKGSDGAALIDALALATQADVAASTNSTGPTRLGGDWALEYQTGIINAAQYDFSNYADLLATPSTFNGGSGIKNVYVRPGGTSNTWTFGVGKVWSDLNQSAPITSIGFSNIDFTAPTTDWILTRGIFQYSVSGGAWTNYTASAAALQYDYQTARVNNANTVWRFLDLLPGNSSTADTVAIGWLTSGETTVVTDSVQIIPDLAPTNITQNLTIPSTNILSTFTQGAAISTLTPVDTGSTTGGYWAIDSQTNANLFSITSNTASGNTANLTIGSGTMPAAGTPVSVTLRYYDGLQTDGSGNPIGGQGYSKTFNFNIVAGQTQDLANFGSDLNISTAATNSQDYSSVTTLSNGNFVVVWQSDGQGETVGKNGIYARIYDATGTPQGSEFAITTLNNDVDENFPVVTALDNGRFAVAYNTATGFDIAYRLVAANGTVGGELIANTATANDQFTPSISTLSDGSFIISWTTYNAGYTSSEVHAQKFNAADGSKNGVELTITATGESHDYSSITALSNGAYVVTWYDYTIGALKAVVSTAPSTVITLDNNDNAWNPQVTGLTGGGFVVAWESPTTGKNIFFQRFDNAGAAQGAVTQANVNGGAGIDKSGTSIDALSGGGFVITWTSPNDDNDGGGIFGRRFTSTGTAVDATEFQINEFSAGNQFNPKVTALAADAFATVWTDASSDGPNNYGIEGRVLLAPDVTPPTVSIAIADSSVILGETPTVTFTFSEAVTGFTNADITSIPNGTLSAVSSSNGGVTYTATFTPTAGIQDASNLFTVNMAGVTDAATNAGVGSTNSGNFAIDTQRPDVAITLADSNLTTGETTTVTFTFTEAVTGFTSTDITVIGGGTLGALSTSDNITFTATFTPTPLLDDATNVITVNKVGVNDTAGNAGSGNSSSANYVVATAGPTVTATFSDTSLIIGDTSLVTFTFSEAVTGFSNADLSIVNGSLTPVSTSNGGVTWTATFTPNVSVADTSNVITITNSGYTSVADGNPGTGTTDSNNYSIDTVRPNATIVVTDTTLLAGETSLVTITFNEAVTNFSNADLTIANGSLSAIASGDGGITWTATLTPSTAIADASNLITLDNTTLNDLAGNAGTGATDSNNYAVQTVRPTVTLAVTDTALKIGDTSTVTFTFSEAVTGFTNGDLTIANGTLSPVSTSDGGVTWTATLTPDASVNDSSNVITITNTGYANAVGNTGTGSSTSNNYAIDTAQPTATIVVADTTLLAGETSLVTITFNEAVTDFSNTDLSIDNGSLSAVSSSDGGITWTANLTPTVDLQDAVNKITLNNSGITDLAGNAGSGSTDSNNYLIETLRPTVSIGVSDTALKIGDTATVTFTFSEAVTNFTNADVTFPNGALGPVSSGDGGTTWTATFTPSADIEDSSNVISVALAGLTDLAGNAGTGTSTSSNYAIDTLRPSVIDIALTDASLTVGETAILSLNFTEAVSGLTIGDITVDNAVPSALSTPDGGTTWNFTVTPNASATNLASFVHVNYANVTDTAGNVGVGIGNFGSFVIDTARPALVGSVTVSDNALKIGDTSTVSFAFTEAVTNLTSADLSTPNGSISNLISGDGGITWTATLTPSISVSDATNVVTLDLTTITDLRGNAGLGTSSSLNYAVDTIRPALASAITFSDSALAIGETATIGLTFTEAVTSFTTADILSPNGVLSNLISGDGGITWTATFTPSPSTYSATNILTLDYTGIVDLAGNAGSGTVTSANYVVDTVRPTLASAMTISDAALKIGDTATVTFTFTEAVTNFTTADVTVENGVLSNLSTANSGITWTATLTPNASVTDTSNILTLNYTGINDLVGNAGTGTATSGNYTIDTVRPTVVGSISFSDNLLAIGETAIMSLAFSEAVTGLTAADFTVPNGVLSNLISSDGGITWTATLTPNANINNASNTITLANTGYTDLNGNTGTGTSNSLNYAIDTMRPTATITMSDIDLGVIDTALVTFTFTEPVTGFTNADLTLPVTAPMGTLSPVSSSDGGLTWTATYTPPFGLLDTSNLISLNTAGVIDGVGNPGVAVVNSPNFTINTVNIAPSLGGITPGLSTTDSNRILPFSSVTVTDPDIGALVMASIGLDNSIKGSFTANSLALSGFVTVDGGSTYQHTPASPAVIQAAIRSLVFEPNPTRLSVGTSDVATFTIQVKDQYLAVAVDANTTLTISNVNSAPTDILISDANVSQSEGANAIVGLLSATDRNVGDSHTFTLGAANASNDNTKFAVVGNTLKVLNPAAMTEKAYFVTVQATDANGLSFFKQLTINLDDDIGPSITSIETLRSPRPTITTGSYIVKFNESVTGVSIDDFFLTSTDGTTAHLSSVTALTGNAYRVYFDQLVGTGVLNLNLKTSGTGIADLYGNNLPISWMPMTEVGISLPNQSIPPEEPSVTSTANLIGIQQQESFWM
jgi:hypothetical protein